MQVVNRNTLFGRTWALRAACWRHKATVLTEILPASHLVWHPFPFPALFLLHSVLTLVPAPVVCPAHMPLRVVACVQLQPPLSDMLTLLMFLTVLPTLLLWSAPLAGITFFCVPTSPTSLPNELPCSFLLCAHKSTPPKSSQLN